MWSHVYAILNKRAKTMNKHIYQNVLSHPRTKTLMVASIWFAQASVSDHIYIANHMPDCCCWSADDYNSESHRIWDSQICWSDSGIMAMSQQIGFPEKQNIPFPPWLKKGLLSMLLEHLMIPNDQKALKFVLKHLLLIHPSLTAWSAADCLLMDKRTFTADEIFLEYLWNISRIFMKYF